MAGVPEYFSLDKLPDIARSIIEKYPEKRIFAISGSMGAGKTTLIKAICRELDVNDMVGSPTFSLVNQYKLPNGDPVYHFDFYRLKSIEEAFDIGYEEYFYSGYYCFIEWPEKVENLLPDDSVRITISEGDGKRLIII